MPLINYLTQIQFGFGSLAQLSQECTRVSIQRPLIVTDAGVRAAGLVDRVVAQLAGLPVAIFDGTPPNPNEDAVRKAVRLFNDSRCDGLIAVGGGSAIDLAKGVAVCARHAGELKSFALIEGIGSYHARHRTCGGRAHDGRHRKRGWTRRHLDT